MQSTFVIDVAFSQRKKTPQGFLSVPCRIARTGTQEYLRRELGLDGDPNARISVYRPPEEVFSPEAISSFDGVPITDEHPPELVDASNWKKYAVGSVTNPRRDGDHLAADLLFTEQSVITDIEAGRRDQLSGGYQFHYESNYKAPDGTIHDAAQTTIRGNHVALTRHGRAGPSVRVTDSSLTGKDNMQKIAIDGIPFEMDPQAAAAVEKLIKQVSDSTVKISQLEVDKASLVKDVDDLKLKTSDAAINERVEKLAGEKIDRDKLTAFGKDTANEVTIKAVLGDKTATDADIEIVRTALRVLDAKGVKTTATDALVAQLGKEITATDADKGAISPRDSYINSFNRGNQNG